jgi:hypothetical protein
MALFTGHDRENVTMLSQFVQIELPKGWEEDGSKITGSELDRLNTYWEESNGREMFGPGDASEPDPILILCARQQHWCRAILAGYADGVVLAETLEAFQESYDIFLGSPRIYVRQAGFQNLSESGRERMRMLYPDRAFEEGYFTSLVPVRPEDMEPSTRVPVNHISWHDRSENRPYFDLITELVTQALACVTGQSKVRRCTECRNPFVMKSGKQSFCSERCSSRFRKRRSRSGGTRIKSGTNRAVKGILLQSGEASPLTP